MNRSDSFNKTSSAVGSTSWMEKELERAQQQVMQDVEEFSYAALRELEWMNEHIRELTENRYVLRWQWNSIANRVQ